MKKTIIFLLMGVFFLSTISICSAGQWVNGYIKRDGTYVQGHMRSSPDGTRLNNWSTKGNTNPYTGKKGYKNPYKTYDSYKRHNPYKYYSPYKYR